MLENYKNFFLKFNKKIISYEIFNNYGKYYN